MNCTAFDEAISDGAQAIGTEAGFALVVGACIVASVTLLLFGERIARSLASAVAFGATTVFLFRVTGPLVGSVGLPCTARAAVALVGGTAAASLAFCLLKGGLLFLGGVAFGTVAHYVYAVLPVPDVTDFVLLGRPGTYFLVVGGAGVVGTVVATVMKRQLLRLTSSLLGGGGLAFSAHLVAQRSGDEAPPVLFLAILGASAGVGLVAQHLLSDEQRRRRRHARRRKEDARRVEERA